MSIQLIPVPSNNGTIISDSRGIPTGINVVVPVIDNSYNYNHTGIYKVSSSSFSTTYNVAYYAFDGDATTFWQTDFSGNSIQKGSKQPYTQNSYIKSKNGPSTYQGGGTLSSVWTTKVATIGNIQGEWLQIQIPSPIYLSSYTIKTPSTDINTFPQGFLIVGSKNGSDWQFVDERVFKTKEIDDISNTNTFDIVSTQSYSYFRLIVTSLFQNNSTVAISEWSLFGVPHLIGESFTTLSILEMNNPYNYKLSESIGSITPSNSEALVDVPETTIFTLSSIDIFFSLMTISAIFFLVINKR